MPPKQDNDYSSDSTYKTEDAASVESSSVSSETRTTTKSSITSSCSNVIQNVRKQIKTIKNRMEELEDFQLDIQKTIDRNYDKVFDRIDDIYDILYTKKRKHSDSNSESGSESDSGSESESGSAEEEEADEPNCRCPGSVKATVANQIPAIFKYFGGNNSSTDFIKKALDKKILSKEEYASLMEIGTEYINLIGTKKISSNDIEYFLNLTNYEQTAIISTEQSIKDLHHHKIPARFRILKSTIPLYVKDLIIRKMEILNSCDPSSSEFHKLTMWVEGLLKVPFDNYAKLPVNKTSSPLEITTFLGNARDCMDKVVYGQNNTKEHIIRKFLHFGSS
jgi:ATP-dependent Lon protease